MTEPAKKSDSSADKGFLTEILDEFWEKIKPSDSSKESPKEASGASTDTTGDAYKGTEVKPMKKVKGEVIPIGSIWHDLVNRVDLALAKAKSKAQYDTTSPDWAEFTMITEAVDVTFDMMETVIVGAVTTFFPDSLDDFDHDHIEDVSEHAELLPEAKDHTAFGNSIHESTSKLDAKTHAEGAPLMPTMAKVHEAAKIEAEGKAKEHIEIK